MGRTQVVSALTVWVVLGLSAAPLPSRQAGPSDKDVAARLLETGLRQQGAYQTLTTILSAGPRLTGSPQAEAAVNLMVRSMTDLGFENVRIEPTTVGRWVRGPREVGRILSARFGRVDVPVRAIGGSIRTPESGITAGVLEVQSIDELKRAGDRANGKIIFFNRKLDPTHIDTFQAYGEVAGLRHAGASEAARAGGVAAVVRSLTLETDDDPHTGGMTYQPGVSKVPAVTISTRGADRLSEILRSDPATRLYFKTSCQTLPPVVSHNVTGELRGTEKPDEIILVGGHLDSWDLSVGAHDDGAGCAQAVEAVRLIKALGLRPARTIRVVLFMDEENGGTGGRDYARSESRKGERHIAAIESDRGGFLPLGMGVGAKGAAFDRIKAWEPLFQSVGLQWIRPGGGGVDIAPLAASGTLMMGLVPDSQRYFDVHHSGTDTIQTVNARELELGAIAMALLAYLLAQNP